MFWKATSAQNPHTIMESQEQHYSFLCCESDLSHLHTVESVVQAYFNPRPVEDDLEDDDSSDFSSDEDNDHDDNIDSDNDFEFEFSEIHKSERAKVEAFVSQGCGCKENHAALLLKLRRSSTVETTVLNFPLANWIL